MLYLGQDYKVACQAGLKQFDQLSYPSSNSIGPGILPWNAVGKVYKLW